MRTPPKIRPRHRWPYSSRPNSGIEQEKALIDKSCVCFQATASCSVLRSGLHGNDFFRPLIGERVVHASVAILISYVYLVVVDYDFGHHVDEVDLSPDLAVRFYRIPYHIHSNSYPVAQCWHP